MFTPQQILQFLHDVQAQHAAQNQATTMPAPEATAAPQQPQPVTPEQLLLLAAMNGMGGGHAPGFWGKGGGYVQGPNLVGEAFGLSNGKVFAQR